MSGAFARISDSVSLDGAVAMLITLKNFFPSQSEEQFTCPEFRNLLRRKICLAFFIGRGCWHIRPWFIISEKDCKIFVFKESYTNQAPCLERLIKIDLDTFRDTEGN